MSCTNGNDPIADLLVDFLAGAEGQRIHRGGQALLTSLATVKELLTSPDLSPDSASTFVAGAGAANAVLGDWRGTLAGGQAGKQSSYGKLVAEILKHEVPTYLIEQLTSLLSVYAAGGSGGAKKSLLAPLIPDAKLQQFITAFAKLLKPAQATFLSVLDEEAMTKDLKQSFLQAAPVVDLAALFAINRQIEQDFMVLGAYADKFAFAPMLSKAVLLELHIAHLRATALKEAIACTESEYAAYLAQQDLVNPVYLTQLLSLVSEQSEHPSFASPTAAAAAKLEDKKGIKGGVIGGGEEIALSFLDEILQTNAAQLDMAFAYWPTFMQLTGVQQRYGADSMALKLILDIDFYLTVVSLEPKVGVYALLQQRVPALSELESLQCAPLLRWLLERKYHQLQEMLSEDVATNSAVSVVSGAETVLEWPWQSSSMILCKELVQLPPSQVQETQFLTFLEMLAQDLLELQRNWNSYSWTLKSLEIGYRYLTDSMLLLALAERHSLLQNPSQSLIAALAQLSEKLVTTWSVLNHKHLKEQMASAESASATAFVSALATSATSATSAAAAMAGGTDGDADAPCAGVDASAIAGMGGDAANSAHVASAASNTAIAAAKAAAAVATAAEIAAALSTGAAARLFLYDYGTDNDLEPQSVTLLGATGSIGDSTCEVLRQHPERYAVHALVAHSNVEKMLALIAEFKPERVAMGDESAAVLLRERLAADAKLRALAVDVLAGPQGVIEVAGDGGAEIVVAAMVGASGLAPVLAALRTGCRVCLANKESLVMSGKLFFDIARQYGSTVVPVDSEHSAIFQCLPAIEQRRIGFCHLASVGIKEILLTGSGGPFRSCPLADLQNVTPQMATKHPVWSMGPKISVDSATMMNKALEFIEARYLFNASAEQIKVVIHPQSVIHSMVSYVDGAVLAQLGQPDMKTPIAHALAYPERISAPVPSLDFTKLAELTFMEPERDRYPCLFTGIEASKQGQASTTALNAANEVAVAAFLQNELRFVQIHEVVEQVVEQCSVQQAYSLEEIMAVDQQARRQAQELIRSRYH